MTEPPPKRIAPAPAKYDQQDQQELRNRIAQMEDEAVKFGRDIELARGERIILRQTADGARYAVSVVAGVLVVTAL